MGEHTFTDPDGVEVFYRTWPVDPAKGVVVIAHGMSEHSGRYVRFARALNAAGYAAYAIDHRAHGRTGASTGAGKLGPGAPEALLDDLKHVVDLAAREVPGVPVILFGHSMGSMISQAYVQRHAEGLAAYALSGCPGRMEGAAEIAASMDAAIAGGMGDEPANLLGGIGGEGGRTTYDWLSRDDAEVDAYIADPYCGDSNPMTYGFLRALFSLSVPAMEDAGIATIPSGMRVLMITGEQDPAAGMGANARDLERRLRDAGLAVEAHYYEGARHELLNETNRDEVTADVISWLDRVVAG